MCGRYTLALPIGFISQTFAAAPLEEDDFADAAPNYNAAPTQRLPIILEEDPNTLRLARWGLIPHWASDAAIGGRMANARSETLEQKPSFRNLVFSRRCLIPADGFYEWQPGPGGKQPYRITARDGGLMAFAGLYDVWVDNGTPVLSYTIITTEAHGPMCNIHERMPLILPYMPARQWLDARLDKARVRDILATPPGIALAFTPVSRAVNNVRNNEPSLLAPDAGRTA